MEKSSKKASKSSLKKLKEEISIYLTNLEYEKAKEASLKMMDANKNNIFGYVSYIKSVTNDYNKYLSKDELKELKSIYNKALEVANKTEKQDLKKNFDDYMYDIKEVDNLNKIKTDIISKEFLKNLYIDYSTFINQNLNTISIYAKDGKKIKNIYDFIKGLFLVCSLVFNLTNINYLLILTIPFGIFGFINMYSFIEMNFFRKGKYKLEKDLVKQMVNNASLKVSHIKQEISKLEENLEFLNKQKTSSINKLPELFKSDIKKLIENDEKKVAAEISEALSSNDTLTFTLLLKNNTNLDAEDIINKITIEFKSENDELLKYINNKVLEKKNNQSSALLMKKVKPFNYFVMILMLFISISSSIIISNNFYELDYTSFIISIIVGFITMLIYNIDTGKHSTISDTFSDNLLNTIFNATLAYNLIYSKINGTSSLLYGFFQIPIILLLVLIGFVKFISILKYVNLFKKLRK